MIHTIGIILFACGAGTVFATVMEAAHRFLNATPSAPRGQTKVGSYPPDDCRPERIVK